MAVEPSRLLEEKRHPYHRALKAFKIKRLTSSTNLVTYPPATASTLQDSCLAQDPAFIGLLSMITGSTLQEEIELTARHVLLQGQNILGLALPGTG